MVLFPLCSISHLHKQGLLAKQSSLTHEGAITHLTEKISGMIRVNLQQTSHHMHCSAGNRSMADDKDVHEASVLVTHRQSAHGALFAGKASPGTLAGAALLLHPSVSYLPEAEEEKPAGFPLRGGHGQHLARGCFTRFNFLRSDQGRRERSREGENKNKQNNKKKQIPNACYRSSGEHAGMRLITDE